MWVKEGLLWQTFGDVIDPPLDHHPVRDAVVAGVVIGTAVSAPSLIKSVAPVLTPIADKVTKSASYVIEKAKSVVDFIGNKISLLNINAENLKFSAFNIDAENLGLSALNINVENLKLSATVAGEVAQRSYINSASTIQEIIGSAAPVKDAYLLNGLKWVVQGTYNGSKGIYDLVIDMDTQTIVHFLFKSSK
jgi:hypothetical protein